MEDNLNNVQIKQSPMPAVIVSLVLVAILMVFFVFIKSELNNFKVSVDKEIGELNAKPKEEKAASLSTVKSEVCKKIAAVKFDAKDKSYVVTIDGIPLEFTRTGNASTGNIYSPLNAKNVILSADCQNIAWSYSYFVPFESGKGWITYLYFSGVDGSGFHIVTTDTNPGDKNIDYIITFENFAGNIASISSLPYNTKTNQILDSDYSPGPAYFPEAFNVPSELINLQTGTVTNYGKNYALSKNLHYIVTGDSYPTDKPTVENIIVRNLFSGEIIKRLRDKNGPTVFGFAFSPDSKSLAYIALDSKRFETPMDFAGTSDIFVLNLETGNQQSIVHLSSGAPYYSIEWKDNKIELVKDDGTYQVSLDGSNLRKIK